MDEAAVILNAWLVELGQQIKARGPQLESAAGIANGVGIVAILGVVSAIAQDGPDVLVTVALLAGSVFLVGLLTYAAAEGIWHTKSLHLLFRMRTELQEIAEKYEDEAGELDSHLTHEFLDAMRLPMRFAVASLTCFLFGATICLVGF